MKFCLVKYDDIIFKVDKIFQQKNEVYGPTWRTMRPASIIDHLLAKTEHVKKILESSGNSKNIIKEFTGIVNYAVIGPIQFIENPVTVSDISKEEAVLLYEDSLYLAQQIAESVMFEMSFILKTINIETINSLISKNISEIKKAIKDKEILRRSNPETKMLKIVNYAIFALMIMEENN